MSVNLCKSEEEYQDTVQAIQRLCAFLNKYAPITNVCMVDFIVEDLFENCLDFDLKQNLLNLTEDQVRQLPQRLFLQADLGQSDYGHETSALDSLLNNIWQLNIDNLQATYSKQEFEQKFHGKGLETNILQHFDTIMGEKKMHEVVVLADVIQKLSVKGQETYLVDLGSGKGYLSQTLANIFKSNVLAIDSSQGNTKGAEKREKNLQARWNGLLNRAEIRNSGSVPPKRGKNWKSKTANSKGILPDPAEEKVAEIVAPIHLTQFVDNETNLDELLRTNFPRDSQALPKFGVIGLHTCGNLAVDSIRIFLANSNANLLVNVGCCYHHLNEEFYRHPYKTEEENDLLNSSARFPLSSVLREKKFVLGRNARMMAAQPTLRMAEENRLPPISLFWRAALQVILKQTYPDLVMEQQQVGKIASKCNNFDQYCNLAFQKLKLPLPISQPDLMTIFDNLCEKHLHRLRSFYQLRSLFSSLIEGLILLDRKLFLLEQTNVISGAAIVKLFDPVISPRCYCIIANKK